MNESDIDLYLSNPEAYEELQHRRPDYGRAIIAFKDLFSSLFGDRESEINVADFCCGTGENSLTISHEKMLGKVTLIDINAEFLKIASRSDIRAKKVETIQSDILQVNLNSEYDVIVSMFAYHHVPDEDKETYLRIAKNALRPGGILILGEIFMPDKETTLRYYENVLESTPKEARTPQLERFLLQTARSSSFEYKVSRSFALRQLAKEGFACIQSLKIWPPDKEGSLPDGAGMYVEAWGLLE